MGIIHSAIKPSNILLRASGHVMISGFAHASLAHADPDDTALDLTLTGGLRVDTPATKEWHEAPEVLLGWKIGFEVDVWGYGIVLGWMALGRVRVALRVVN
ncbi:hypothetical protein FA95DRAFT_1561726 [Auriscalpium vulgare]|uniref:Uncharacterized protein n=1 Tax=Auriscalpium vulgare TaxID=40419 RepID=A0ACB8RMZ9_9AGAM|nr:hypothetical protein FA95DRAFT_1561726 [Auriscalpium vulgare]